MSYGAAEQAQRYFCRQGCEFFGIKPNGRAALAPGSLRQGRGSHADRHFEGGLGPPQPPRQQRETPRIEPLMGESRHQLAPAHTGEAWIAVRWILSKRDAGTFERGNEPCLRNIE